MRDFNISWDDEFTREEWMELLALEYVLTWQYSEDADKDYKRYRHLSDKRWEWRHGADEVSATA